MSCAHCTNQEAPVVAVRSRFCVSCGRRLPPSPLPSRRVRLPLQRTLHEEPAPTA